MEFSLADKSGENGFLLAKRCRRLQPFNLDRQVPADIDLLPGNIPAHVCCFETILVEKKTARPHYGGGSVAETADFLPLELAGVLELALTVKNISLSRAPIEKDR